MNESLIVFIFHIFFHIIYCIILRKIENTTIDFYSFAWLLLCRYPCCLSQFFGDGVKECSGIIQSEEITCHTSDDRTSTSVELARIADTLLYDEMAGCWSERRQKAIQYIEV